MGKPTKKSTFSGIPAKEEEIWALLEAFAQDIVFFSETVCNDLVRGGVPEFHQEMYDLALRCERLLIAAPRGFSKSCILSRVYPLWCALMGDYKDIMVVSASESLAMEHVNWIKRKCERDPNIRGIWGDVKSKKWTEGHIGVKSYDGGVCHIRAKGATGQIRGFRPDCIIVDDAETDESVMSSEQCRKIKDWLFKACINTLLPGGQFIMIGTILKRTGVLNDLFEGQDMWERRKYKAYKGGIEKSGNELWPELRPHKWLQKRKKEIGSHRFYAEFMNDPVSDEAAPIKDSQLRYWQGLPDNLGLCIVCDPAYSEEKKADYKTACVVGIDQMNNQFLVKYIRHHKPMGEYMDDILNLFLEYRGQITGVGVPSTGVEKSFFQGIIKKAQERNLSVPFIELKNTFVTATGGTIRGKKERIIAALQPLFEQGKFFVNKEHHEAIDEILSIGNNLHDDIIDCLAYAQQILQPIYFPVEESYTDNGLINKTYEGYGIDY